MILFTLCIFTTFILSGGYGGAYGQSYGAGSLTPIDFNDDFNNRNLIIKPNENIIYNFQQIRKDQPPQVEQRNENIGRYMYKPKATTAMPIMPSLDNFPKMEPLPNVPTPIVPVDMYNNHWNHVSAFPPTIPPPPSTPKWADLSQILNKQNFPHYNIPAQTTASYTPHQSHYPSVLPAHYQPQPAPTYIPAPAPEVPTRSAPSLTQVINQPVSQVLSKPVQAHRVHPEPPQLPTSRGSHKFSWNDVSTSTTTTTYAPPPAVGHQNRGPPSSFPTLSPWADGFGK